MERSRYFSFLSTFLIFIGSYNLKRTIHSNSWSWLHSSVSTFHSNTHFSKSNQQPMHRTKSCPTIFPFDKPLRSHIHNIKEKICLYFHVIIILNVVCDLIFLTVQKHKNTFLLKTMLQTVIILWNVCFHVGMSVFVLIRVIPADCQFTQ